MSRLSRRQHGILLVAVSAVLWSTAGLLVRLADLDGWTIVAWRSLFACATLGGLAALRTRSGLLPALRRFGLPGLVSIAVSVVSAISYVVALRLTTVANVMTVYAALPFVATALAFFWFGERVTARFLVAGSAALCGIVLTVGAAASPRDILGIVSAGVMTAGFATQLVYTKRHPTIDTTLMGALAAGVCVVIATPFAQPIVPAPIQLVACALFGVLTTGLAYVLVLAGGRLISSGEAGLISMLDIVLGPFWVWLFYAEEPTTAALVGGTIVLVAVAWYLATSAASAPSAEDAGVMVGGGPILSERRGGASSP